jgi:hypothetical protein
MKVVIRRVPLMSLISALIQVRSTWLIQYYNAFGSKLRLQHRFTNIKIATCIKNKKKKKKINKYYFEKFEQQHKWDSTIIRKKLKLSNHLNYKTYFLITFAKKTIFEFYKTSQ